MSELYRDFIDRKLTDIDNHLIDIINGLQPVGPSSPVFSKTLLCDNSSFSSTFTLSDSISNYDIIEFITKSNSYPEDSFFIVPDSITDIEDLNTTNKLICFNSLNTNRYVCYSRSGNTYTRYNQRIIDVVKVYGYKCTNKTTVIDNIYKTNTKSTSYITVTDNNHNLYDYDLILWGYNASSDDEIGPFNIPIHTKNLVTDVNTIVTGNYNAVQIGHLSEHTIDYIRPVYIYGIKFT